MSKPLLQNLLSILAGLVFTIALGAVQWRRKPQACLR